MINFKNYMVEQPKFIPLPEVGNSKVRFNLALPPFVNQELLGINVRGVERLLRVGGIGHLRVESKKGEVSSFVPTVVGVNGQGEALAGKIGFQTLVPTYKIEDDDPSSWAPYIYRWVNSMLSVNVDEISQQILYGSKRWERGIRTPEAWAHFLDRALGQGIENIGNHHLIEGIEGLDWSLFALSWLLNVPFVSQALIEGNLARLLGWVICNETIFQGWLDISVRLSQRSHYRWSIFATFAPHLDRALVLKILSRTTTLVKALPEK